MNLYVPLACCFPIALEYFCASQMLPQQAAVSVLHHDSSCAAMLGCTHNHHAMIACLVAAAHAAKAQPLSGFTLMLSAQTS